MNHPELDPFVARVLRQPFDEFLMEGRRTSRGGFARRTSRRRDR